MVRYIALLNGINPAGHKPISMEDLKAHFEMPELRDISTYMQSGNVLFTSELLDEGYLRGKIEKQLEIKLGYEVKVILRMFDDIRDILKNNPFAQIKNDETRKLYVTLLSDTPPYAVRGALGVYSNDAEDARLVEREVYILSNNYGKTCFPNSLIEKKLGVAATTRNWATLQKITEL